MEGGTLGAWRLTELLKEPTLEWPAPPACLGLAGFSTEGHISWETPWSWKTPVQSCAPWLVPLAPPQDFFNGRSQFFSREGRLWSWRVEACRVVAVLGAHSWEHPEWYEAVKELGFCLSKWSEKWKSLSCVWLFVTLWTIQSMEFSRPEYWSGYLFPSPGDLPNPGIEPRSLTLQVDSLPAEPWSVTVVIKWYSEKHFE